MNQELATCLVLGVKRLREELKGREGFGLAGLAGVDGVGGIDGTDGADGADRAGRAGRAEGMVKDLDEGGKEGESISGLFGFTENYGQQAKLASSFTDFRFALKGGAKTRKAPTSKAGKDKSLNLKPGKKRKTSEGKEKSSKLSMTFSPKMKKKQSLLAAADSSVDLSSYTSPSKTTKATAKTPSPRKSPRSPSRKVIFDLDRNMVLEFNKKKIISRSKMTPQKSSSKGILKTRTSPRRKDKLSDSN